MWGQREARLIATALLLTFPTTSTVDACCCRPSGLIPSSSARPLTQLSLSGKKQIYDTMTRSTFTLTAALILSLLGSTRAQATW